MCGTCFDQVWRAELDGNGVEDYVIVGSGPDGNSRSDPQYSLTLLLMDSTGMPFPFFKGIYHGEKLESPIWS